MGYLSVVAPTLLPRIKTFHLKGKGGRTRAVHNGLCLGEQRTASQSRRDSGVALTPLARSAPPLPLLP